MVMPIRPGIIACGQSVREFGPMIPAIEAPPDSRTGAAVHPFIWAADALPGNGKQGIGGDQVIDRSMAPTESLTENCLLPIEPAVIAAIYPAFRVVAKKAAHQLPQKSVGTVWVYFYPTDAAGIGKPQRLPGGAGIDAFEYATPIIGNRSSPAIRFSCAAVDGVLVGRIDGNITYTEAGQAVGNGRPMVASIA